MRRLLTKRCILFFRYLKVKRQQRQLTTYLLRKKSFYRLHAAIQQKKKYSQQEKTATAWHMAFFLTRRCFPTWRHLLEKKRAHRRIALISIAAHNLISAKIAILRLKKFAICRRRHRIFAKRLPHQSFLHQHALRRRKASVLARWHSFAHDEKCQRFIQFQVFTAFRALQSYAHSRWAARLGRRLTTHRLNRRLMRSILYSWRAILLQPRGDTDYFLPKPAPVPLRFSLLEEERVLTERD